MRGKTENQNCFNNNKQNGETFVGQKALTTPPANQIPPNKCGWSLERVSGAVLRALYSGNNEATSRVMQVLTGCVCVCACVRVCVCCPSVGPQIPIGELYSIFQHKTVTHL
jgi:hypothetical protein